jgi:hypothetical protein
MFVRRCDDPLVGAAHQTDFQHSYCFHSCGYRENGYEDDTSVCTADGNCLCSYPCSDNVLIQHETKFILPLISVLKLNSLFFLLKVTITQPQFQFDTFICPPSASDPADTDPTARPRCLTTCANLCPGGVGEICSEVRAVATNTYGKICTCYCPIQQCAAINNGTTSTSSTSTSIFILPPLKAPLFLLKKKLKWKLLAWKFFKLCWLILKLCGLWAIQHIILALYAIVFYEWISWEYRTVMGAFWAIGSYFRNSVF